MLRAVRRPDGWDRRVGVRASVARAMLVKIAAAVSARRSNSKKKFLMTESASAFSVDLLRNSGGGSSSWSPEEAAVVMLLREGFLKILIPVEMTGNGQWLRGPCEEIRSWFLETSV
jgi:hypothetical protein